MRTFCSLSLAYIVTFFCLIQSGFSQKTINIEKVIIKYEHAENYRGKPRSYIIEEIIQFDKPPKDCNLFYLTQYLRINEELDHINPPSIDSLFLKPRNVEAIKGEIFDELMRSISNSADNFTEQFIRPYLKKIRIKDIVTVAKQSHFKTGHLDSSIAKNSKDRRERVNEIRVYSQLKSFLFKELENIPYELVITEAYHFMTISFIMTNDTITYRSNFFGHSLRQPFILMARDGSYTKNAATNLNINLNLMKILPKGSLLKEKMDFNSISEDYIKWYLKRYCNYAVK
jgi:hypothetical protein